MLPKFDLYMPTDLAEACRLKADGAKVVAGGTDVFVNMHGGKDHSAKVVDVKNIPELQGHSFDPETGLDLGALTTHRDIELWDVIKQHYRAMFEGCSRVGSVQIRTRGTLGGNICNGAPSADSIGPMLVHDAAVVVAGPNGERTVPLKDFYLGLKKLDMQEDELLKRILIPAPKAHSGSFYIKYTRRNAMDLALLGVSAYVELDGDVLKTVRIACCPHSHPRRKNGSIAERPDDHRRVAGRSRQDRDGREPSPFQLALQRGIPPDTTGGTDHSGTAAGDRTGKGGLTYAKHHDSCHRQ